MHRKLILPAQLLLEKQKLRYRGLQAIGTIDYLGDSVGLCQLLHLTGVQAKYIKDAYRLIVQPDRQQGHRAASIEEVLNAPLRDPVILERGWGKKHYKTVKEREA